MRTARPHMGIMSDITASLRPLRVASYNIRKCVGLDWRRTPERTLDVIAGVEADIVALQEVDKRLGPRPAALPVHHIHARTDLVPVAVAANDVSLGWHGNALLVRPGITVDAVAQLDLPALEPRGAVIADLTRGGQPIRVVATHLGLLRRHRLHQLTAIRAALAALEPRPTVILGDFNEWSASAGMTPLESGFAVHSPGRSFHASRPVAGLDRIAICAGLALKDAGVTETALSARASDHLPIWADLDLTGRSSSPAQAFMAKSVRQDAMRAAAQNASGLASCAM
ncbi:endonuclease/exonuclease/phosphatase family protein [Actibacterium sp. D379-3]